MTAQEPFDDDEARRVIEEAGVAGTAHKERAAVLEDLRDRIVKALDKAVEPVAKVHEDRKALVEMWGGERDRDPAFREKVFGRKAG